MVSPKKVVNPKTGKLILVDGPTFKKLSETQQKKLLAEFGKKKTKIEKQKSNIGKLPKSKMTSQNKFAVFKTGSPSAFLGTFATEEEALYAIFLKKIEFRSYDKAKLNKMAENFLDDIYSDEKIKGYQIINSIVLPPAPSKKLDFETFKKINVKAMKWAFKEQWI